MTHEAPKPPAEQEQPSIRQMIAAITDGKFIDIDQIHILLMADGTMRWTPKKEEDDNTDV